MTIKLTTITAALMLATTAAHAIPNIYNVNPTDYRTAYESINKHVDEGQRAQVLAELPRVGIHAASFNGSQKLKYLQGIYDLNGLLATIGMTWAEYAPPAEQAAPIPFTALTPSTPAAQQPPQDNGAAAAAKAAALKAAQTAGTTAGQNAQPVTLTVTQVITPPAPTVAEPTPQPLQIAPTVTHIDQVAPPMPTPKPAPVAMTALTASTPTQASLDKAADAANRQVINAQNTLKTLQDVPKSRIDIPVNLNKTMAVSSDYLSTYQHDAAGYYMMVNTPEQMNAIRSAQQQLTKIEQEATDAQKAADDYRAAHPVAPQPTAQTAATAPAPQQDAPAATQTAAAQPAAVTPPAAQTPATEPEAQPVTPPAAKLASMKPTEPAATATAEPKAITAPADDTRQHALYAEQIAQESAQAINQTSRQVNTNTATIAHQEQAINRLNQNFAQLKRETEQNKEEARAGIAGVAAMANIPSARPGERLMIGAGVGTFKNEQALAVGASINAGEHTAVKFSVSSATNGDFAAGAGIGIGF
ncbi:TPA: YadA C-terminal domain-containing protein [Salmonella enterica subsp. enterica serovar Virchow]